MVIQRTCLAKGKLVCRLLNNKKAGFTFHWPVTCPAYVRPAVLIGQKATEEGAAVEALTFALLFVALKGVWPGRKGG